MQQRCRDTHISDLMTYRRRSESCTFVAHLRWCSLFTSSFLHCYLGVGMVTEPRSVLEVDPYCHDEVTTLPLV